MTGLLSHPRTDWSAPWVKTSGAAEPDSYPSRCAIIGKASGRHQMCRGHPNRAEFRSERILPTTEMFDREDHLYV